MKLLLAFMVLLAAEKAFGAQIYVAKTGSNTNNGSMTFPYLTAQKGVDMAQPGDTVIIGAGDYPEYVGTERAGTSNAPIIVDGQGGAQFTGFSFDHPYVHIQNLALKGGPNRIVHLNRGAHGTVVSNCVVDANLQIGVEAIYWRNPSTYPFNADASSYCTIVSNRVTGVVGATAINIYGDFNEIRGNYVHDLGQADFVRLWGRSNHIVGNTFTNIYVVPGVGNHIDFIQTFGDNNFGSLGHVIENNVVTTIDIGQLSQLTADAIPEIRDWTFRNNVFSKIYSASSGGMPGNKWFNNTFYKCCYGNGGHAINISGRLGHANPADDYLAHNCQLIGNVFYACGLNSKDSTGWYFFWYPTTNGLADYNFVANDQNLPKQAGTVTIGTDANQDGVGDWSNYRFYELHGINGGNPLFVDPEHGDFRLQTNSPLRNVSLPMNSTFTTDFAGKPRGDMWDMGAFEFEAGYTTPPTNAPPVTNAPPHRARQIHVQRANIGFIRKP